MPNTPPSPVPSPTVAAVTPQALANWQALLQHTVIQSHLGQVLVLPRWAEGSQPWKAS